ncbi:MAG: hypothetical protein WA622_17070 [Mycobacterium sp.]|uniref:hypothetical protein n=1 Tax=Mycobacterium sp. TaxID=1785 RepID=UPI003BB5BCFD
MHQSTKTSAMTRDVVQIATPTTVKEDTSPAPVFITEQEVLFGTRAAVSSRMASIPRRLIDTMRVAVAALQPPPPRHYPRDRGYFERSRMAREMDRL